MGRQVLEDTISFFYLCERNLSPEEKSFRELVWRFHGKSEHVDSAKLAEVANPELTPAGVECEELRQKVNVHRYLQRLSLIVCAATLVKDTKPTSCTTTRSSSGAEFGLRGTICRTAKSIRDVS